MENIIEIANRYLLENEIDTLPIDFNALVRLFDKLGFEVFSYRQANEVLQKLKLCDYAVNHKAFTVILSDIKIVFYRDNLSTSEKIFCLAHELGHIVLGHIPDGLIGKEEHSPLSNAQEQEADRFAYAILAPMIVLKKCRFSVFEISRATLLSEYQAEVISTQMQQYHFGVSDRLVAAKFHRYIEKHSPLMLYKLRLIR